MGLRPFLLCMLFFGAILLAAPSSSKGQAHSNTGAPPSSVEDLLYARPFTLANGYKFTWSKEQPIINAGVIVVLRVDPELVVPTNAPDPILYAGDRMVHRLNSGHRSGHVIGIIPGEFDFVSEPIWFGQPERSGYTTPERIKSEHAQAKANIRPFSSDRIKQATRASVQAPDLAALLRGEIAELVLEYSPDESELARKWRLPEAVAKPNPARPAEKETAGTLR